jgi:hypothetical protein
MSDSEEDAAAASGGAEGGQVIDAERAIRIYKLFPMHLFTQF